MKLAARILLLLLTLTPTIALADAPSLQVNPLKYQSTMLGSDVRDGYVDVSNPTDTTVNVEASVQGFRQDDLAGDLSFFSNLAIQQAITLGLTDFQLGPQEAIRDTFSVDPTKLPQGGTYAAIFFRTIPPQQSANTSYVAESANVGTLLLLQNGPLGEQIGKVTQFNVPFFQFGNGITGTAQYKNTNNSTAPVAFAPKLIEKVFPWGHAQKLTGPYVLPGSTRQFETMRPGSYFGLVPVSMIDGVSGIATTRWVIACTGAYAFTIVFLVALLIVIAASRVLRNLPILPSSIKSLFKKRGKSVPHTSIDGLAPKS
jgi:hypothetical protein